jgi:hypothetical protein
MQQVQCNSAERRQEELASILHGAFTAMEEKSGPDLPSGVLAM